MLFLDILLKFDIVETKISKVIWVQNGVKFFEIPFIS